MNIRAGAVTKATKLLRGPKQSLNRDLPISFPTRVRSGDKNYILIGNCLPARHFLMGAAASTLYP